MFGPRISKVFSSRLHSLWWSAMVLVTAYCVAIDPPAQPPTAKGSETAQNDGKHMAKDPWASVTKKQH